MNTQELKLRILADLAMQGVQPSQQIDLAKPIFEWIAKVENPAECTLSASADGVHFAPICLNIDGKSIEAALSQPKDLKGRGDKTEHKFDSPNVTHQTPEEVLRANGFIHMEHQLYGLPPNNAIRAYCVEGKWLVSKDCKVDSVREWNPADSTFEDWLTSNVAALTEEKAEPKSEGVLSEYDLPALHKACLEWAKNPKFPAWWDGGRIDANQVGFVYLYSFDEEQCCVPKTAHPANGFQILKTARLIGMNIEDYRIS